MKNRAHTGYARNKYKQLKQDIFACNKMTFLPMEQLNIFLKMS